MCTNRPFIYDENGKEIDFASTLNSYEESIDLVRGVMKQKQPDNEKEVRLEKLRSMFANRRYPDVIQEFFGSELHQGKSMMLDLKLKKKQHITKSVGDLPRV